MFKFWKKVEDSKKKKVYGAIRKLVVALVIAFFLRMFIFSHIAVPLCAFIIIGIIFYLIDKYFHDTHPKILKAFISISTMFLVWIPQVSHAVRGHLPDTIQSLYETAQVKDKEHGTNAKFYNDLIEGANNDKERYQKRLGELKDLRKRQPLKKEEKEEEESLAVQIHEVDERVKRLISLRERGVPPAENKKEGPTPEPEPMPASSPVNSKWENVTSIESNPTPPAAEPTPLPVQPILSEPSTPIVASTPVSVPVATKPTLVILLPENVEEFKKVTSQNHKKRNIFLSNSLNLGIDILGRRTANSIGRRDPLNDLLRNNQSIIEQPTLKQNENTQASIQPSVQAVESTIRSELLNQAVSSGKFRVIESANRTGQSSAEFYLHSAFGQKNLKITSSTLRDQEIINLLGSTLAMCPDQASRDQRTRDILSATNKLTSRKGDTLIYVVVNIYFSRGDEIVASTFGIGVANAGASYKPRSDNQLQSSVLESIRNAIQDALDNLKLSN